MSSKPSFVVIVGIALAGWVSTLGAAPTVAAASCVCPGDCDSDCAVSDTEFALVLATLFAADACAAADADGDGRITAADVLIVHAARAVAPPGCALAPTATATQTATATDTASLPATAFPSVTRTASASPTATPTPRPATASPTVASTPISRWISLAPMPAGGRQEVGVAQLGGRIYVIGGLNPQASARVDAYDIANDQWSEVATLPIAGHHIGAAALGGHIYAIGGLRPPGFSPTRDVFRYDASADRWDPVAPLPTARGAMAVAVADGMIHVIAGDGVRSAVTDHAAYIPEENRWIELAPYPLAREHIAAASVDGTIYVVGGRSPLTDAAHRWDDGSSSWVPLPPMSTRRAGHAVAALNGRLVTFGGEGNPANPRGIFPEVEFYDPATNRWTRIADMQSPRHGIGAVSVGNRIYVPGGADLAGFGRVATNDALEIDF